MKVPRPREDGNAAGQHLRRARDSGPGYAVAFFLVVRGLTENNVCLVRALSGRVAGRWQLATWRAAFWVSGPVRVWNDFPPTSAPQPGLCHHPGERWLRKSCSFREVFPSPVIHGWAAQEHSCESTLCGGHLRSASPTHRISSYYWGGWTNPVQFHCSLPWPVPGRSFLQNCVCVWPSVCSLPHWGEYSGLCSDINWLAGLALSAVTILVKKGEL